MEVVNTTELVSTEFSHLDEFERKLAEMEQDLDNKSQVAASEEKDQSFKEVAADFKETIESR